MRHFPATISRADSDENAERIRAKIERDGWGLWAVEVVGGAAFIGFAGLWEPRLELHFTPCVEVGYRLAREHWGTGYAAEAARASLRFGFAELGLDEIVAWTAVGNTPSRRVLEKLGMTRDPADDFEHPLVPAGHPARPHVLYRVRREALG